MRIDSNRMSQHFEVMQVTGVMCRLELFRSIPAQCIPHWDEWVMLETIRPLRTQRGTGQWLGGVFNVKGRVCELTKL